MEHVGISIHELNVHVAVRNKVWDTAACLQEVSGQPHRI